MRIQKLPFPSQYRQFSFFMPTQKSFLARGKLCRDLQWDKLRRFYFFIRSPVQTPGPFETEGLKSTSDLGDLYQLVHWSPKGSTTTSHFGCSHFCIVACPDVFDKTERPCASRHRVVHYQDYISYFHIPTTPCDWPGPCLEQRDVFQPPASPKLVGEICCLSPVFPAV